MSEVQELPQGWTKARLGNILPIQYGKGLTKKNRISEGRFPVYGSSGIVGFHDQILTSRSTLIIGRKGSVGSVYYSQLPCWPIDTTYFAEEESNINLKFFLYLISSLQLKQFDKSTAIPGLNRDDYNALTIWLPPLSEQQRIVEALEQQLSRLDAGVAALRSTQKKLKRYRASVLKAAVEGKLTEERRKIHPEVEPAPELLKRILKERRAKWEEEQIARGRDPQKVKYDEPAGLDVTGLSELPEGWCWATIEQISVLVTDGDHNPPTRVSIGIPHLTARNIVDSHILLDHCTHITKENAERVFKRYKPLTGDLIITCVGTIGRTAIVPNGIIFSPDRNLAAVRPVLGYNFTKFLEYCILSPDTQIKMGSASGSTAQPHLYLADLRALSINLPPLAEQEQIVSLVEERLSIVATLESTIEQVLKRAERMRQSILHRAFTGKLVAQDPNDEPASVLLERIQREREEATAPQKVKRLVYKEIEKSSRKRVAEQVQPYLLVDGAEPEPVDPDMKQGELWDARS